MIELKIGDKVVVTAGPMKGARGEIEVISYFTVNMWGTPSVLADYYVRLPNQTLLEVLREYQLDLDTDAMVTLSCECGAIKAAAPYKPAGHGFYCPEFKGKSK